MREDHPDFVRIAGTDAVKGFFQVTHVGRDVIELGEQQDWQGCRRGPVSARPLPDVHPARVDVDLPVRKLTRERAGQAARMLVFGQPYLQLAEAGAAQDRAAPGCGEPFGVVPERPERESEPDPGQVGGSSGGYDGSGLWS